MLSSGIFRFVLQLRSHFGPMSTLLLISRVAHCACNWLSWTLPIEVLHIKDSMPPCIRLPCFLILNCSPKWVTSNSFAIYWKYTRNDEETVGTRKEYGSDVAHHTLPVPHIYYLLLFIIFIRLRFLCVRRCADTSINLINVHADKSNTIKINHFLIQYSSASCTQFNCICSDSSHSNQF